MNDFQNKIGELIQKLGIEPESIIDGVSNEIVDHRHWHTREVTSCEGDHPDWYTLENWNKWCKLTFAPDNNNTEENR